MRLTATALAAILLSSCASLSGSGNGAPGVMLLAESPAPGVVRLMLENGSRNEILYNLCTSSLQRQVAGGWENVPTGEACTMELRTLNPGADATFDKTLPADIPSGQYRYVTRVESRGTMREIAGARFTIR